MTSYTEANIAYEDFQPRELESANLIQMARLDVKVYPRVQSVYKVSFVSKTLFFLIFIQTSFQIIHMNSGPHFLC